VENVRPRGEFRMRVNIQLFITFQITPLIMRDRIFLDSPIVLAEYF
jgi:hypothetical protein